MRLVSICFVAIVTIACSQHETPTAPDNSAQASTAVVTVRSLSITGSAPVFGGNSQLTATANFSDGSSRDVTSQATWSSSDPSVLTVSAAGMASGVRGGQAFAQASYQGAIAVLQLNIVIVLPPPPSIADVFNCEKRVDDASDLRRTLYVASYPRSTLSQVDVGFTSRNATGSYSVKLTVLVNGNAVASRTSTIAIGSIRQRAAASFVFTPALNVAQGSSVRFIASLESGPGDGELSWEGQTDSACPVIVVPDNTSTTPIIGPKIPVRVVG